MNQQKIIEEATKKVINEITSDLKERVKEEVERIAQSLSEEKPLEYQPEPEDIYEIPAFAGLQLFYFACYKNGWYVFCKTKINVEKVIKSEGDLNEIDSYSFADLNGCKLIKKAKRR
jgi:hypothetical protein